MDPNQPQVYGPTQVPEQPSAPPSGNSAGNTPGPSSSKKPLIIAGALGVVILLVITIVVVLLAGSAEKAPIQEAPQETQNPQPATSIGVEQINNSLSQDLSTIDDARDFPENQLSDENLGL